MYKAVFEIVKGEFQTKQLTEYYSVAHSNYLAVKMGTDKLINLAEVLAPNVDSIEEVDGVLDFDFLKEFTGDVFFVGSIDIKASKDPKYGDNNIIKKFLAL